MRGPWSHELACRQQEGEGHSFSTGHNGLDPSHSIEHIRLMMAKLPSEHRWRRVVAEVYLPRNRLARPTRLIISAAA